MPFIDRQFLLLPILILPGSDSRHPISLIIIQVETKMFLINKDTKIKWLKSLNKKRVDSVEIQTTENENKGYAENELIQSDNSHPG